jgi:diphosphomevalonate decarboxylase
MKKMYEQKLLKEAKTVSPLKKTAHAGQVKWESPSNIAIVKYWGKRPVQVPTNASLSITLQNAKTITAVKYEIGSSINGPVAELIFEGVRVESFAKRIALYLQSIVPFLPWLANARLSIRSENTFPHSSGIASSASSMSALAMCLCEIDSRLVQKEFDDETRRKASFLARLGSGSASRSVYPGMAVWGLTAAWKEASDEYAIPVEAIHASFQDTRDSILIIESGKKEVSSSLGHSLMNNNPFAETRFTQAENNMQHLKPLISKGDWNAFIDLMENEALTLHAMMMTSHPGYILMQPNTVEAIKRIRQFRSERSVPVGFTLDAGANVHVLYPGTVKDEVSALLDDELAPLCENGTIIDDTIGNGPGPVA